MLRHHRNALFEDILATGLDPADFGVEDRHGDHDHMETVIYYKQEDELLFVARSPNEDFYKFEYSYSLFSPGYVLRGPFPGDKYVDIEAVRETFRVWLEREVKRARDNRLVPDFWTSATAAEALVKETPEAGQAPFTEAELAQIELGILEFRRLLVESFQPTAERIEEIDKRLQYLQDAAHRLNRFDWKGVAVTTLISVSTALSLNTEQGRKVFELFLQALHAVLHWLR